MTAPPTADQLPSELLTHDQWVCWQTEQRDSKQTKVPIDPSTGRYASTTSADTWTGFEQAREYARKTSRVAGLGFVFTDDDPFVGIDLDNCRDEDEDEVAAWARDIIDRLDSYTEISPSGTGYHVIVRGSLPDGPNRSGDVECYATARYFTVTGDSEHDPPRQITERSSELAAVHADYVMDNETADREDSTEPDPNPGRSGSSKTGLDDETAIQKAMNATNGAKFERLWNGSTGGYESHSEADMALCFHLAFWTGGDLAQIDRLFRRSDLMREKWDAVHFADGSTYGEKTVERAVECVDDFYDPTPPDGQSNTDSTVVSSANPIEGQAAPQSSAGGADTRSVPRSDPRLHDVIDRLEARVDQLEAENEALREQLAAARGATKPLSDASLDETTTSTEPGSFWDRLTSRLGVTEE